MTPETPAGMYEKAVRAFWLSGQLELRFPFPNYNAAWTIELRLKGVLDKLKASASSPEDRERAQATITRIFTAERKSIAPPHRKGPVELALLRTQASSEEIFAERLRNLGVKV